jgi:thioredoxin reductase (NADPH)
VGQLALHDSGYVIVDDDGCTSVPGVWAPGDVSDYIYRQIATSVGSGCKAAIQAEHYIAKLEHRAYPGKADLG